VNKKDQVKILWEDEEENGKSPAKGDKKKKKKIYRKTKLGTTKSLKQLRKTKKEKNKGH